MNEIDKLIIKIEADTKQLKAELKKIEGKIKTTGAAGGAAFGMAGSGMGATLKKLKGPLVAATAGLVAMGVAITKIAKVGAEFQDLKDSLDTVFGSMKNGDVAMQRILSFAQTTPFQIDTVTKSFIALKSAGIEPNDRMMQVFADTASTSVDQLGVFEALVRTVQRSASGGLGLEELNMIMDRGIDVLGILNTELGLTKNEIADFGATAEGAKLVTDALINGLERKFGGAMQSKMDNLSTATSNMIIAFKTLGDELFKSGLGSFLTDMANALGRMAQNMAKARAVAGGRATTVELVTPEFSPRADKMQENIIAAEIENQSRIQARMRKLTEIAKSTNLQIKSALKDSRNIDFSGMTVSELLDADLSGATANLRSLVEEQKRSNGEFQILSDLNTDIIHQQRLRKSGQDGLNATNKEDLMLAGMRQRAASLLAKEIEKLTGDTELLEFASKNLQIILDENKDTFQKLGIETVDQLREKYGEIIEKTTDVSQTFSEVLAPAIQSMALSFTNDFVSALMNGENALESFNDFSKNIVSQIISTFLQLAVVNKILMSIFGPTGFNVKGFNLPTLASGGAAQRGQPTIVGERGPELFVPHSSGTMMNNMNTKNAMGGGTTVINQSINFATGVVPTVRAEVMKMMPQIADVTKGAVAEAAMRGGNYRRMLQGG